MTRRAAAWRLGAVTIVLTHKLFTNGGPSTATAGEIGARQMGTRQGGIGEVGPAEVWRFEFRIGEVNIIQVRAKGVFR
ncbi:MAG TPA: hypothetical protein VK277_06110 [Acidimicrobiales bacterium]|nr:hypothetical protein [Acidimicrobiales bacterium]